jgi:glycosyltransferase involved in cell wall biosynthesis
MTLLGWTTLAMCAVIVASGIDVLIGLATTPRLGDQPPRADVGAPAVSIVVAARDEERGVERAMASLLAQRYPALEFVAVDDRSTDRTGEILDRLAATDPRLRVVHLRELPAGWLGKNHALWLGAAAARGEWLLFTDADVVMTPDAVSRAVAYAEREGRDFLTLFPVIPMPGLLLQAFVASGGVIFHAALRPRKARDPKSRHFVGVGAFNLVRASAYARAGGHQRIRLRPDDDIKLGKILKRSGASVDAVSGSGMVSVEWYHSLGEAIDGLMKNSFSVVEYHPVVMLAGIPLFLVAGLGPLAALWLGPGPVRIFGAVTVLFQLLLHAAAAREVGAPRRAALLYPLVSVIYAWIILRALVLNLSLGGITWRGTFYSLTELRKNRV